MPYLWIEVSGYIIWYSDNSWVGCIFPSESQYCNNNTIEYRCCHRYCVESFICACWFFEASLRVFLFFLHVVQRVFFNMHKLLYSTNVSKETFLLCMMKCMMISDTAVTWGLLSINNTFWFFLKRKMIDFYSNTKT